MCFTSRVFQVALVTLLLTTFSFAVASDQADRVVVVSISGDWKYQGARVSFGNRCRRKGVCSVRMVPLFSSRTTRMPRLNLLSAKSLRETRIVKAMKAISAPFISTQRTGKPRAA